MKSPNYCSRKRTIAFRGMVAAGALLLSNVFLNFEARFIPRDPKEIKIEQDLEDLAEFYGLEGVDVRVECGESASNFLKLKLMNADNEDKTKGFVDRYPLYGTSNIINLTAEMCANYPDSNDEPSGKVEWPLFAAAHEFAHSGVDIINESCAQLFAGTVYTPISMIAYDGVATRTIEDKISDSRVNPIVLEWDESSPYSPTACDRSFEELLNS